MKSAYTPAPRRTRPDEGGAVAAGSAAYKNLEGVGVTMFGGPNGACLAYTGSVIWSVVLIGLDATLLGAMGSDTAIATPPSRNTHGMNAGHGRADAGHGRAGPGDTGV